MRRKRPFLVLFQGHQSRLGGITGQYVYVKHTNIHITVLQKLYPTSLAHKLILCNKGYLWVPEVGAISMETVYAAQSAWWFIPTTTVGIKTAKSMMEGNQSFYIALYWDKSSVNNKIWQDRRITTHLPGNATKAWFIICNQTVGR